MLMIALRKIPENERYVNVKYIMIMISDSNKINMTLWAIIVIGYVESGRLTSYL